MRNYKFLNRLTKEQMEKLEKGLSKTFFKGQKVEILKDEIYQDGYYLCIDNKKYSFSCMSDFNLGRYNEKVDVAYCSYLASIFKDEYVDALTDKYYKRAQETKEILWKLKAQGKYSETKKLIKDDKYCKKVLSEVYKEYKKISLKSSYTKNRSENIEL